MQVFIDKIEGEAKGATNTFSPLTKFNTGGIEMAKESLPNNLSTDNLVFHPLSTRPYFINLTGQRFGHLTVLGYKGPLGRHTFWYCQCECGNVTSPSSNQLRRGVSRSCGSRIDRGWPVEESLRQRADTHQPLAYR